MKFENFTLPDSLIWDNDDVLRRLKLCDETINKTEGDLKLKLTNSMTHCLKVLENLGGGKLHCDFAPLSFTFHAGGFFGGMIFHGAHDGYGNGQGPTFSVSLTPAVGWMLHT